MSDLQEESGGRGVAVGGAEMLRWRVAGDDAAPGGRAGHAAGRAEALGQALRGAPLVQVAHLRTISDVY